MRIRQFRIQQYGPLRESGIIELNAFNLFYGENEDGKTLTIEALTRLLFPRSRSISGKLNRVQEPPDGRVILQDADGQEITLIKNKSLEDITGIPAELFYNLFIIRNSDLVIEDEEKIYGDITEKLTGLQRSRIQQIMKTLKEKNQLTPGLDFSNKAADNYLKKRLEEARALLDELQDKIPAWEEMGYLELEAELVRQKQELQLLETEIEKMKQARQWQEYEQAKKRLEKLKEIDADLRSLGNIHEEDLHKWQQLEREIRQHQDEEDELAREIAATEKEQKGVENEFMEVQHRVHQLEERQLSIQASVTEKLQEYDTFEKEIAAGEEHRTLKQLGSIILAVIAVAFFVLAVLQKNWLWGIPAVVFATMTAYLLSRLLRQARKLGQLSILRTEILQKAAELGIAADSISGVKENIRRLIEQVDDLKEKMRQLDKEMERLKERSRQQQTQREKFRNARRSAMDEIAEIRLRSGLNSLKEHQQQVVLKREKEQQKRTTLSLLQERFDVQGVAEEQMLAALEDQIEASKPAVALQEAVVYSEQAMSELLERQKLLQEFIQEAESKLEDFRSELRELEKRVRDVLHPERVDILVQSFEDLEIASRKLQEFVTEKERLREAVARAVEIWQEIEQEEEEKVQALFKEDSRLSSIFQEITGGLYTGVHYDSENKQIRVVRRDGRELTPEQLSGGTFDQLYFSIRVALGEKLFDKGGFFILDDPFIKADAARLRRLLDMLFKIVETGWQILYFTAKDEVREALAPFIKQKKVKLLSIPEPAFKKETTN